jgi:hypothetical protein
MEVTGQLHALAALTLEPTKQEAGWTTELVQML